MPPTAPMPTLTVPTASPDPADRAEGYGRARLWLGITGVGTMVVASTLALSVGLPGAWYGNLTVGTMVGAFAAWLGLYAILQAPLDWGGGWLLPRRFRRPSPRPLAFAIGWLRGVIVQAGLLGSAAVVLTLAGHFGEWWGTVAAATGLMTLLLWLRMPLAWLMGSVTIERRRGAGDELGERWARTDDESFTGGIVGVLRPRASVLPARYAKALGDAGLSVARARRLSAVRRGLWWRGRAVAVVFTAVGVAISAALVGQDALGTAGGTVELSLWFTLWAFVGLLTLPTLSRRAVAEIDRALIAEGTPAELLDGVNRTLTAMQDGETRRPGAVEAIFHPIPSAENRAARHAQATPNRLAAWDAARTAIYLSASGLGLLGRAVHCNAGKPALWVFLPTD